MSSKVPFFSNTKDNTHCNQAILKSVLKYFFPKKDYSFKELEEFSGKKEGLWTWPTKTMIDINMLGLQVRIKEIFDYKRFAIKGGDYLLEFYGKEAGNAQINHSDIPYERNLAKEFLKIVNYEKSLPSLKEIQELIDNGWLVAVNVNYFPLYEKDGYSGHFVLILRTNDKYITVHDPGLPPRPNQKIPRENFLKAWGYPSKDNRNYVAYKKAK